MSDITPEKIYITESKQGYWFPECHKANGDTEYIRSDIVEQMVKEAVDRVLQKRLGKPKR